MNWIDEIKALNDCTFKVVEVTNERHLKDEIYVWTPCIQLLVPSSRLYSLMANLNHHVKIADKLGDFDLCMTKVTIVYEDDVFGSCEPPDWIGLDITPLNHAIHTDKTLEPLTDEEVKRYFDDWKKEVTKWLKTAKTEVYGKTINYQFCVCNNCSK